MCRGSEAEIAAAGAFEWCAGVVRGARTSNRNPFTGSRLRPKSASSTAFLISATLCYNFDSKVYRATGANDW